MAMPGALTICRGLNRKCVKHTGNDPNVTNGSSLLDLFLFFGGGLAGCSWFRLEIVGCNGSQPDPHDSPSCTPLLGRCPWLNMLMLSVMLVTLKTSASTLL